MITCRQGIIAKKYYNNNKEKVLESNKAWASEHKEERAEYMKGYRDENKERLSELNRLWREENYESHREASREYQNTRLKTDPIYKLVHLSRMRMRGAFKVKSQKKLHSTHELIGCTPHEFKAHLESMFDSNMNWENYGDYWVVDHIIPIASFDLSRSEEQKKAFHYTNCQPMEKIANIKKSDSMPGPHERNQSCYTNNSLACP